MDGENNGNPYFLMDDLGVPLFSETPIKTSHQVRPFGSRFPITPGLGDEKDHHGPMTTTYPSVPSWDPILQESGQME